MSQRQPRQRAHSRSGARGRTASRSVDPLRIFRLFLGLEDRTRPAAQLRDDPQLDDLFARRRRARAQRTVFAATTVLLGGISLFFFASSSSSTGKLLGGYFGSYTFLTLIAAFAAFERLRDADTQYRDRLDELDLRDVEILSVQQRAEKLFKINSNELKRYYDQTLRHSSGIFWLGIVAILGGLSIMFYTIHLVIGQARHTNNPLQEKIIVAALGSLGAILINFIAVIYLKMYSSIREAMTVFHNRLVLTNHLHFANLLGAQITDVRLRESTLAAAMTSMTGPSGVVVDAAQSGSDENGRLLSQDAAT